MCSKETTTYFLPGMLLYNLSNVSFEHILNSVNTGNHHHHRHFISLSECNGFTLIQLHLCFISVNLIVWLVIPFVSSFLVLQIWAAWWSDNLKCSCLSTAGVSRLKALQNIPAFHPSEKVYVLKLTYVAEFPPESLCQFLLLPTTYKNAYFFKLFPTP